MSASTATPGAPAPAPASATLKAFDAFMKGWSVGAAGGRVTMPKRNARDFERGYYAGQTAREQALRMARATSAEVR